MYKFFKLYHTIVCVEIFHVLYEVYSRQHLPIYFLAGIEWEAIQDCDSFGIDSNDQVLASS